MATQLTNPEFLGVSGQGSWQDYYWVYLFAFAIGFATTIAEPSLLAVAIALGSYRIVAGDPIHWHILGGYVVVVVQTFFAPKNIIPLAYDSGGVTTSTVTVPLVAALGKHDSGSKPTH